MDELVTVLDPGVVAQHPSNVRDASRGLGELAASIAEVGVLVPLIVVPVDRVDGHEFPPEVTHVAVDGNRRQAAAARVGAQLPCLVRPDLGAARETALTMAVTGLVRDGFTTAEEVHATQIMLDLGVDVEAIARATARPVERVKMARTAAGVRRDVAEQAYERQVDLEDLAAIAEFQDDAKAVKALIDAADRGLVGHELSVQRRKRQIAELVAEHTAELSAKGVAVTKKQPCGGSWDSQLAHRLEDLRSPAGKKITALVHRKCPGHAVYLEITEWVSPPTVERVYVCLDPETHGHVSVWSDEGRELDVDPAEREARQAERAAQEEAAVRWSAAAEVRAEFIRSVVARKSLPAPALEWAIARVVCRDATLWRGIDDVQWTDATALAEVFGLAPRADAVREWVQAQPSTRHPVILWASVVSAIERHISHGRAVHVGYLEHLADIGYTLSDAESAFMDGIRAELADLEERIDADDGEGDGDDDAVAG